MSFFSKSLPTTLFPLERIRRPIVPVYDETKIEAMKDSIKEEKELPPVDVFKVKISADSKFKPDEDGYAYFAFGGCHRLASYDRIGIKEIPVRIMPATPDQMRLYLGMSL